MIRDRSLLAVAFLAAVATTGHAMDSVQFDYAMNCQGCHLPSGNGYPDRGVPNFNEDLGRFLHIEGGREFLIQVPGSAQSDLDDQRLTAVVNWMLVRFCADEIPANFEPYSVEEVAELRRKPLIDVKGTRKALIEKTVERDL